MGFTRWPSDLTADGVQTAGAFANAHGDIVSVMFIGGIPWPEAHDGKPFSKDVEANLRYRPPAGKKLFLSISPLNQDRSAIAPYWGEKDNLPLPPPWDKLPLDSPEVLKAYPAFVLRAVAAMHPDYLAIGIESNVLLSHDRTRWAQLKTLHRSTYRAVKAKYPDLPICFTTEVIHYKRLATEARGTDQAGEVADLMQTSDLFAMSVYPFMSAAVPSPLPADFFDFARQFHKPIAISESGMISQDVTLKSLHITLHGSEADQTAWIQQLLQTATRDRYAFVINFATTDFEKLCDRLPPPADDIARIWAYTGLQTSSKHPKPALPLWDATLALTLQR